MEGKSLFSLVTSMLLNASSAFRDVYGPSFKCLVWKLNPLDFWIFGHVVLISQAYLRLLRAGYAALIGAILSFSRGFWLTVFGFMYSSMVLDSSVKVRCLVLCINKCLGRRCRSVIDMACVFFTCFTFAR
jgi:hypothetical protein